MSGLSLTHAQQQFTAHLSAVEDAARYAFRRMRRQDRDEALAAACGAAWSAWAGLLRRGKNPVEVGVHAIARNAILYVKSGRKLGNPTGGRGARDIWHPRAQRACGYRVVGLDRDAERESGRGSDAWREWLACDHRVGPADEAAFRVDFAVWLNSLPERKREIAELLTEGHEPGLVARIVGVSPARVSQLRHELAASWRSFQGEATPVATVPV
jgi:hypothetical protein